VMTSLHHYCISSMMLDYKIKIRHSSSNMVHYFRFRSGSGRLSNILNILENPTEVFARAVAVYG
jgi:hypothetical protein